MASDTYTKLSLVGRHVPDENSGPYPNMSAALADGHDTLAPVTGTYEIGAMIDGAFVPLIVEKASLIFDRIELAKSQAASDKPTS